MRNIHLALRFRWLRRALLPEIEQTFHTDGITGGRRGFATQQTDQTIVTATTADCALGAETIRDPLENREIIVIEPAHQTRIETVFDARVIQTTAYAIEMGQRFRAKKI